MSELQETDEFDRLMDALQTIYRLQSGVPLTEEQVADIQFVEDYYRREDNRATDAFAKGYQCGLEHGVGADTATLIEERDEARSAASIARGISSSLQHIAFIQGAQICREMMARFVDQGGSSIIAGSIRANWRPSWGQDPGAPSEELYASAAPCEITCKEKAAE